MRSVLVLLMLAPLWAHAQCPAAFDIQGRSLNSDAPLDLCDIRGDRLTLVVNTASQCGYTPQYKGLQTLHERYAGLGLSVIGFPATDFRQEFSDESRTAKVCYVNYGVTFPLFATGTVTGEQANALFRSFAAAGKPPRWNFNKYLLDSEGNLLGYWGSSEAPTGGELEQAIRDRLAGSKAAQ